MDGCSTARWRYRPGACSAVTPKTYLPNYREFYEKRQFAGADAAISRDIRLFGETVPFGNDLLFEAADVDGLTLHVEICEDLWTPIPPSTYAALGGATVLLNLSASNITIGKAGYRHDLCAAQSGKCVAAYLYSAAGPGESTTDLAWDGHALMYENSQLLAESERFPRGRAADHRGHRPGAACGRTAAATSFSDSARPIASGCAACGGCGSISTWPAVDCWMPLGPARTIERFPYVPAASEARDERCFEAYNIQVHGLAQAAARRPASSGSSSASPAGSTRPRR